MPRKNEFASREIYRLWWKYLRRSPKYKEYCDKPDFLISEDLDLKQSFEKFGNVHSGSFDEWWKTRHTKKIIDEKNARIYKGPKRRIKKGSIEVYALIKPLEEYTQIIWDDFVEAFEKQKHLYKREPSFQEFFEYFPKYLLDYHPNSMFLKININETGSSPKRVGKNELRNL